MERKKKTLKSTIKNRGVATTVQKTVRKNVPKAVRKTLPQTVLFDLNIVLANSLFIIFTKK